MALHPGEAGYEEQQDRNDHARLLKDAARACTCDGGNTMCRACRAEKRLRENGQHCGKCAQPGCKFCFPKAAITQHVQAYKSAAEFWRNNYQRCTLNGGDNSIPELMEEWASGGDKKPTHPVGVSVLVTDSQGRILLGRRKNNTGAGLLSTPGGRLEVKETLQQCAARELLEETGIKGSPEEFALIGFKEHFRFGGHYIMFYMHARGADGTTAANLEPDKCEGWDWHRLIDLRASETTEPSDILARLATILAGW